MPGTWQPLTNQPPFQACTMLLLTDGSVFCNAYYSSADCWRFIPDNDGSYVFLTGLGGGEETPPTRRALRG